MRNLRGSVALSPPTPRDQEVITKMADTFSRGFQALNIVSDEADERALHGNILYGHTPQNSPPPSK
jgi:hypothetical protein